MNNFNNFLSHLNSFGKPNLSDVPTSTPTKKPYMGGNYKKDQKLKLSKNKNEYYGSYEPAPIATPAIGEPSSSEPPVVSGYNYPETMVGSFDPQPSEPAPIASPPISDTPAVKRQKAPTATPPATNLMPTVIPAKALPTATGTALQMGMQAAEMKGADAWGRVRAGEFDFANEDLPSANFDPLVVKARADLEASRKFREDHDARAAVNTTNRNKVRDNLDAEAQRMRNSPNQSERDLQAMIDERRAQDNQGPAHQARLREVERLDADLRANGDPTNPNNTTPTDSRPRDSMGHLLEESNITTFADHMKFLSNNSGKLNEENTSYDDVESSRIRGANERSTTGLPQNPETIKNLDKAWDYRNSWLAKGKIKDTWNKMTPTQQQQARNYAKSKGRDFSEMDSALNETSNHNIFLNHLNSFSKKNLN